MTKPVGHRVVAYVAPEMKERLDDLKQRRFYASTWSDLLRFVLAKGLDYIDMLKSKGRLDD